MKPAVALTPNDVWSRLYYANILWCLKKNDEAAAQYAMAAEIPAKNAPLLTATAGAFLGDFLSAEQINPERAEVLLRRAIEFDGDDATNNYMMGRHLWRYERDNEARPFLEKALTLGDERAGKLLAKLETS